MRSMRAPPGTPDRAVVLPGPPQAANDARRSGGATASASLSPRPLWRPMLARDQRRSIRIAHPRLDQRRVIGQRLVDHAGADAGLLGHAPHDAQVLEQVRALEARRELAAQHRGAALVE